MDTLNLKQPVNDRFATMGLGSIDDPPEFLYISMHLYIHCQEFKLATNIYYKLELVNAGMLQFHVSWHVRIFNFALISIHNAKKRASTKRRLWSKRSKKYVAMIRTWVNDHRAINMGHKLLLLEAELLTLRKPYPTDGVLIQTYDDVIVRSARTGYLQDAALAASLACSAVRDSAEKRRYAQRCQEL
jgi:hypothetical protein